MFKKFVGAISLEDVGQVADQLVKLRNEYDYPRAFCALSTTPTEFKLAENVWVFPVGSDVGEVTDLELDKYHFDLLHSESPVNNLLGTCSVIYWGYYTFSENYALERIRRHLKGYKGKVGTTPAGIHAVLSSIKANRKNLGKALAKMEDVSQLGRTPFASKVVALMYPEIAGIYDNLIAKGLSRCDWKIAKDFTEGIGGVSRLTVQRKYVAWCDFTRQIAEKLTDGICSGKNWYWTDTTGQQNVWRAIDVERALFRYFKVDGRKTL